MVPERHEHVARVADHDDVAHLRIERQRVERQVALDEPPVLLRVELCDDGSTIAAPVEPRRDGRDRRPRLLRKSRWRRMFCIQVVPDL